MCKIISSKIHQLSKIKHFLDLHSRKLYFSAYIENYINYASTVWDAASDNTVKPLASLHRRALKLVMLKSSSLTTSDYFSLQILPLKWKLKYNKAVFMFKILSGSAPPALVNSFSRNETRHKHKLVIPLPRIDLFKSSLAYSGGDLWNKISNKINILTNLSTFKISLHSNLFEEFMSAQRGGLL